MLYESIYKDFCNDRISQVEKSLVVDRGQGLGVEEERLECGHREILALFSLFCIGEMVNAQTHRGDEFVQNIIHTETHSQSRKGKERIEIYKDERPGETCIINGQH